MSQFTVFDFQFDDPELESQFVDFFERYDLHPLFTNEFRAGQIKVSELDAKSVVNVAGTYEYRYYDKRPGRQKWYTRTRKRKEGANAQPLKNFTDVLHTGMDNKMYESATFRILYNATSFKAFMNSIKDITNYFYTRINEEHKFNTWNIVWYNKQLQ